MDDQSGSMSMSESLGTSNNMDMTGSVPAQVLFMNPHDVPARTNAHPPPSGYYQVATPKSPHELILDDQDLATQQDDFNGHNAGLGQHGTKSQDSMMGRLDGESEETERLKYETAKTEILDKLHLQTLISHKEAQGIEREIKRVDAQMMLFRKLHDDKDLEKKVEEHTELQNDRVRRQLSEVNTVANSSGYLADTSASISFAGYSPYVPLSASNIMPTHHYHTRSKSSGNVTEVPHLRPANSVIIDMRLAGSKSIPHNANQLNEAVVDSQSARPNQMNMHHRRNYSSTCLTSNSGVIGKNEANEAIFKRYDGILIVIKCSFCPRSGFTSAQGIVNHTRLKHGKTYSSQPLAVLNNQRLLEDSKQDPQVLEKFKKLEKDPLKEYLPSEVAIPCSASKSGQREPSPTKHKEGVSEDRSHRMTNHLKKLYKKEDFEDLVEMVNDASKDLEEVLKQPSPECSESEEEEARLETHGTESEGVAASSANSKSSTAESSSFKPGSACPTSTTTSEENTEGNKEVSSTASPSPTAAGQRRSARKRKNEQRDIAKDLQERARPAEKKARPDVLALTSVPEHDKRSSHYNLRAKSKLRGHNSFQ